MQHKRLVLSALLLLGFGLTGLQAQETTASAGGEALGSGGSVSYSIGQVVYTTNTGTNGSVVNGIQQPYEISEVTGLEDAKRINLMVSAYPNPSTDYITLIIDEFDVADLSYQVYDMNGISLQKEKINNNQTRIDMGNLVPSTYFVKVFRGSNEVKMFKIIKTQ